MGNWGQVWDHPPCSSQLQLRRDCRDATGVRRVGNPFQNAGSPVLARTPTSGPPSQSQSSVSGDTAGDRSSKGNGGVSDGRPEVGEPGWPVSHPSRTHRRLGEGYSVLPQEAPKDLQRPSPEGPSTFADLDASVPRHTARPHPPTPPGTPGLTFRRPQAPQVCAPPPEAPRWSRAARVSARVRGPAPRCPGPLAAARLWGSGAAGGRWLAAGAALEAGRPGIVRGPRRARRRRARSRVPPPAARLWSGGRGELSPARPLRVPPSPARPSPLRPLRPPSLSPLPGSRARPPGLGGDARRPARGKAGWRRGARPGPACAPGRGRLLLPAARGRGARAPREARARGLEGAGCRAAGRGVLSPGCESAPAGGRCPGRGGARQGRAGRRSSRPEHPRPLPTPAFLLQL